MTTPFSPPFGPASVSCNGPHLPTHLDRYGALASAGASGRLKPALHCTAQVTLRSTLQRSAGSGAQKQIPWRKLQAANLEDYYAAEYPVAASLLAGKDKLSVRIQAKPGKPAASVYNLRLVTVK